MLTCVRRASDPVRLDRDRHMQRGPLTECAFDPDLSIVSLDDAFADRQAKSCACPRSAVALPEAFEDARKVSGRNSRTGVLNRDLDTPVAAAGAKHDPSSWWRELEGVSKHVGQYLMQSVAIGIDPPD